MEEMQLQCFFANEWRDELFWNRCLFV